MFIWFDALHILEYVPSGPEAPKFVSQLEHKEIFESMPVKLMCEVIGFPEPEITWLQVLCYRIMTN